MLENSETEVNQEPSPTAQPIRAGKQRKDDTSEREALVHIGFKADEETLKALDKLMRTYLPDMLGTKNKSNVIRYVLTTAAKKIDTTTRTPMPPSSNDSLNTKHVGFKADKETVEAIEQLSKAANHIGVIAPKSLAIRMAIIAAARKLPDLPIIEEVTVGEFTSITSIEQVKAAELVKVIPINESDEDFFTNRVEEVVEPKKRPGRPRKTQ